MSIGVSAPVEFSNASGLEFVDISSEAWREYLFSSGVSVRIVEPLWLHVSDSGGHRLFDASGRSHYIPSGWAKLTWVAKDGEPHFVK
jgi:hypothetical protein